MVTFRTDGMGKLKADALLHHYVGEREVSVPELKEEVNSLDVRREVVTIVFDT